MPMAGQEAVGINPICQIFNRRNCQILATALPTIRKSFQGRLRRNP
jgi:hypothetical protein